VPVSKTIIGGEQTVQTFGGYLPEYERIKPKRIKAKYRRSSEKLMDTNTLLEREVAKAQLGEFGLDPSLVLYLPLWKKDGASFMSEDAYGHLCTRTGALWRLDGHFFDGSDDYIEVAHHASQLLTTGGSIAVWIKPSSAGEASLGRIFDKSDTNYNLGTNGYAFYTTGTNRTGFAINNGTARFSAAGSVVFGDGNFYYAVVTWDATGLVTHYINGIQSGAPATSSNPVGIITSDPPCIGNLSYDPGARSFDGMIGEVWVYNRVLTVCEIQRMYLATKWRYSGWTQ